MNIWQEAGSKELAQSCALESWRIVEDQSRSTTRKFVDTAAEHDILENIIDAGKPKQKYYGDEKYFRGLHYLLSTPFRYPPLKWGSRFGVKSERSIFYASESINTAMSEVAFYKLAFFNATTGNLQAYNVLHTAFRVNISSNYYIDLTTDAFSKHQKLISNKEKYNPTQALGHNMRSAGIECFGYKSARDENQGANFGVFTPKALRNNGNIEKNFMFLNCFYSKNTVEFSYKNNQESSKIFPIENFLVDGILPIPTT